MITKQYITIVHYIWRGFESWYLLRLLPFHQDQDLLLLFSAFLGLEWLGFAKRFPSNKISYISLKYHILLWIRICQFGKELVIFNYSIVSRGAWQKKMVFALWKLKWSNSPLKPLLVFANLRIQERLYTFLRLSAIALKTSTGCVQHFRLTCSFAGGLRPTFFSACRNSLLPSASSFSSVMVTSGSGCHFSLSLKIKKMNAYNYFCDNCRNSSALIG